ncbi:beta-ketoacyl synthase N-terminal-like domain-containing protein [Streptomyces sp. NPDC006704]|uniref:beta-ketoacyl synthase N-terminal-like domain-containing protein n=1 Tax=Streptomyces sp. NPDC006704 TaxID=3364760 RepID=UPI0036981ABD
MSTLNVLGVGVCLPGTDKPTEALSSVITGGPGPGWLDVAAALPGRGYKRLPPGCQYLLAATANAQADADGALFAVPADRRGIVVGTNNAGMALLDEQDRTIIDAGADAIAPLSAPYFAMSLFASRLATEHRVNGFTLTVNSPRTAALDALAAGARALAAGRADALVVGATEETLPDCEPGADSSDTGAVALICARPDARSPAPSYGTVRVRTAFLAPGAAAHRALENAWRDLTADTDGPPRVDAIVDDSPVGEAVLAWLGNRCADLASFPAGVGALTPMRHLVAALAAREGRHRILVTAAAEGNVAFARLDAPLPTTPLHPQQNPQQNPQQKGNRT